MTNQTRHTLEKLLTDAINVEEDSLFRASIALRRDPADTLVANYINTRKNRYEVLKSALTEVLK